MSSASITIGQSGVVGSPGRSRDDLVVGVPVTLRNANDADVRSWRWILAVPSGSSSTLSNVVAAAPSFTPDVAGTYVATLAVDQGNAGQVDTRLVAVRNPPVVIGPDVFTTRYLGISEADEADWNSIYNPGSPNESGWWEDLDQWLHMLQAVASTAGSDTTEPITDPSIVEALDTITLTMGDRALGYDSTSIFPLAVVLPAMVPGDAGLGHRCSVVLPEGNPGRVVDVIPAAGQAIVDPATGLPVPLVSFPSGTFGSYSVLTFEAVPSLFPPLPGTVLPPLVPDFEGAPPNGAPIPVTISGTGGTLPALVDLLVELTDLAVGPPITLAVTSAVQGGGPGTPWTIIADIPIFALPPFPPGNFDLTIADTSGGPPVPFAALGSAFYTVFPGGPPTSPPSDTWLLDINLGGGAAARWDEVLVAGPNSNGEDAYMVLEDGFYFSVEPSPMFDPTSPPSGGPGAFESPNLNKKSSRFAFVPGGGGGTYVSMGSAIFTATGGGVDGGPGNRIHIRAVLGRKRGLTGLGLAPSRLGVLEEIWSYSFGTWTKDEVVASTAEIAGFFRFLGIGPSIFAQVIDDAADDVIAQGHVEYTILPGFTPV